MNSEEKKSGKLTADSDTDRDIKKQHHSELQGEKNTDFDSAWKDVIEGLFEPFSEFFFPEIHRDIDFSKEVKIMDSESRGIAPYGKVGKRYADKLIQVHLKNGSTACVCVFVHVEVQGTKEKKGIFPERAYVYNYRTYDKNIDKGIKVISVAILTDEDENYRPDEYLVQQWGFELRMKIPMVKIIDFKNKKEFREKLETSDSPMAMIVLAQLERYKLKKADNNKKSTAKLDLIRRCYERKYTKEEIRVLLKFIDWLILLPEGLNEQLSTKIEKLEEDYKMPYVTSWERIAEKKGVKIGKQEGVIIGKQEGVIIGKQEGVKIGKIETARKLIKRGVAIDIIAEATGFSKKKIEKLSATAH